MAAGEEEIATRIGPPPQTDPIMVRWVTQVLDAEVGG
jgi:hypothetical protein